MTILAFLQNMWVRDPERVKALVAKKGEGYRRRFIRYALFAGSLTGRRLLKAFGEDLCERIIWEECSREIGSYASAAFDADLEHMRAAIAENEPEVILAFGRTAREALAKIKAAAYAPVIYGPHPAARGPETERELQQMFLRLSHLLTSGADV